MRRTKQLSHLPPHCERLRQFEVFCAEAERVQANNPKGNPRRDAMYCKNIQCFRQCVLSRRNQRSAASQPCTVQRTHTNIRTPRRRALAKQTQILDAASRLITPIYTCQHGKKGLCSKTLTPKEYEPVLETETNAIKELLNRNKKDTRSDAKVTPVGDLTYA